MISGQQRTVHILHDTEHSARLMDATSVDVEFVRFPEQLNHVFGIDDRIRRCRAALGDAVVSRITFVRNVDEPSMELDEHGLAELHDSTTAIIECHLVNNVNMIGICVPRQQYSQDGGENALRLPIDACVCVCVCVAVRVSLV